MKEGRGLTDSATMRRLQASRRGQEAASHARHGAAAISMAGKRGVTGAAREILDRYVRQVAEERDRESDPLAKEMYDFAIMLATMWAGDQLEDAS